MEVGLREGSSCWCANNGWVSILVLMEVGLRVVGEVSAFIGITVSILVLMEVGLRGSAGRGSR